MVLPSRRQRSCWEVPAFFWHRAGRAVVRSGPRSSTPLLPPSSTPPSYLAYAAGLIAGAVLGHSASLLRTRKNSGQHAELKSERSDAHQANPKLARVMITTCGMLLLSFGVSRLTPTCAKIGKARYFATTGMKTRVYSVALTGGPCGGKSTSLNVFSKELAKRGYDVYRAPEIPTILINGGCTYPGIDGGEKLFAYESYLMDLQIQTEDSFKGIASSTGKPSVVVMDRGLMDIKAYIPEEKWDELLKRKNLTERSLLERYDMVLHLVTAANGAEDFYTKANNAARTETPTEARALDMKLKHSWQNHKHHAVIDNSSNFKDKMDRATEAISGILDSEDDGRAANVKNTAG